MTLTQTVYHDCGMKGDAKSPVAHRLNLLKNRFSIPALSDVDSLATLSRMVEPGNDEGRWSNSRAAEIVGYVLDVKKGGLESCNCHAKNPAYRDTDIELVLDPMNAGPDQRVIAEITPRVREKMKHNGVDWSTATLRKKLLGRWVKVRGWLMFDVEHKDESENINPGRTRNWRATAWEVHPITSIEIAQRPH